MTAASQRDYDDLRSRHDAVTNRLRAAITEAILDTGLESREHRRLRWALSGERPVEPLDEAAPPRHAFIQTIDHGQPIGLCAHIEMMSGHEGTICYGRQGDPIHQSR